MNRPFSFSVQGVHNGTITVRSKECAFEESRSYTKWAEVLFTVPVKPRCLYLVSVMPEFTDEESYGLEWRGLFGVLMLRGSQAAHVEATQARFMSSATLNLELQDAARIYLSGCGVEHDQYHAQGRIELELEGAGDDFEACVVDGVAKFGSGSRLDLAVLLSYYRFDIARLPLPELKIDASGLSVAADRAVSLIALDGESRFGNRAVFKRTKGWLRLYTAQGRYVFCRIDGRPECFN